MNNRRRSLQITVAAAGASLAAVFIILTNFLPLTVSLITFAAAAYYIVFDKAGIVFGFLSIAAASAVSLIFGFGTAQILNLVLFAPYAVFAYFLRKFWYDKLKPALLRSAAVVVFFNLVLAAVFFLAGFLTDLPVLEFIGNLPGGYAFMAVLVSLVMIPIDAVFSYFCKMICLKIKFGNRS